MDTRVVPSICRNCLAYCPILVTIEGGRAVKVVGDPDAPAFDGYSCPKGRALPAQHNDPLRLLRCMRRGADGRFGAIDSALAMDQIARRVEEMIARHGPRAIALYSGTGQVSHPAGGPIVRAWARAIGTRMNFSASTIDKPAEYTSVALHGNWHAGLQTFETSDTWMIVGANPVIAKSNGAPFNNPGMRLKEAVQRGMKMIVIDPRRTETAKRAHVHLQPRPGQDFVLLAGIIHIVIEEKLYDADFIGANVEGFSALKAAVAEFTPAFVAQRADVPVDRLLVAARTFGSGKRGGVVCSTGPSFATHSNLTYYLALCLNTLCGRWARAGDAAPHSNVLLPAFTPRAQPYAPYPVISDRPMRVHGLWENASGVPTAALADEILLDGEGQIKVLFCLGGNPVLSWPDQKKTEAALKKLDLLVVLDYQMTATAQFAHYVIPPPLSLELPGSTQMVESLKYAGVSRGYPMPWAQYTPAVIAYPPQSDLLDDGAFFFGLAQRMGLQLEWLNVRGQGPNLEGPTQAIPLDMRCAPSVEEMVALACAESRVPLEVVKTHPHGQLYSLDVTVQSRDPACSARLQLGDETMMEELRSVHADDDALSHKGFPLRLISRRNNNFMNSVGQSLPVLGGAKLHTPAQMNAEDMSFLGIVEGAIVTIRSHHGSMLAQVAADDTLRRGVVSVFHGFGDATEYAGVDPAYSVRSFGSVSRLLALDERDPVSGIPRLTGGTTTVAYAGATYSDYTKRYYRGPSGEFLDAFVFTGVDIGEMPLNVKIGQHTVIWGESLFTTIHGISSGQSPVDLAKAFATPGVEAKEVFRPLNQISAQLGVTENFSIAAQYYFDWSATRLPEGGTYLGIIDMGFMGPTNFNAAGFGANSGNNEPDKRGDWGLSARWSPAWLDGTLGVYYRNFTDKTPTLFRFVPAAGTPYYKTFFGEDIDLYGISLSKQIGGVSVGAEMSYRRNMPLYSPLLQNLAGTAVFNAAVFPNGVPTLNGNTYQARGNTVHAVLNGIAVLPAASLGDFTLFDTAVVLGELTYSYLDKITANRDMFQGVDHGICDASRRAALGTNYRDKWDGCSTKEALGMTLSFTPSWLQVFPGVDLLAPMSFSKGLYGNSPVALGGNEDNGSYSIGLAADVYAQYRFDLKWVDYFGAAKYGAQAQTGSRVTTVNGLSTLLRDRGFLSLTFKTTF